MILHLFSRTAISTSVASSLLAVVMSAAAHAQAADIVTVRNPVLRAEILRLVDADQLVQRAIVEKSKEGGRVDPGDVARKDSVFAAGTARIRQILREHGWPGHALVGTSGSHGAWLLLQHADADTSLQKLGLQLMERAVRAGDASRLDFAYLVDRVRVAEGRPQVYGTQLKHDANGCPIAGDIESAGEVNRRRASVGLEPLADYFKMYIEAMGKQRTCAPSPRRAGRRQSTGAFRGGATLRSKDE